MAWSKERQREYMKEYYRKNPEKWQRDRDGGSIEHEKARKKKAREYHHKNRDVLLAKKRADRRLKIYGLPDDVYQATLRAQNGECAICQRSCDKLAVDHCHETGRIRALLCRECNLGLGHFRDDHTNLAAACSYLRAWEEIKAAAA